MYQGNWPCTGCSEPITELPFMPKSDKGLTCRKCYMRDKEAEKREQPVAEMATVAEAPPMDDAPDFDEFGGMSEPIPADDAFAGLEDAAPATPTGEKKKFEGSWPCSMCDQMITSLPFEPKSTAGLKCLDCYKASRA